MKALMADVKQPQPKRAMEDDNEEKVLFVLFIYHLPLAPLCTPISSLLPSPKA